ncbi:hypothetical protein IPJ63_03020 [Candidatus Nomurabacteria bacterium]|nr:MAG: hypothetical protein IPJ63_03020 [Candidatus Nomurabacteria bacterium]
MAFLFSGFTDMVLMRVLDKRSEEPVVKNAEAATYQFFPTDVVVETGTEQNVTSATIAATEGTNLGSHQGMMTNDGFHWQVAGAGASGISMVVTIGGVGLNGANKLDIGTEIDMDATAYSMLFQICDFTSTTNVDNAADANCTGGGWRTINTQNASNADVAYTDTANDQLRWQLYNGVFSNGTSDAGTPIDTPLTYFVNGSNEMKFRYYSTTSSTSVVSIDYLTAFAYIDSVYYAADYVDQVSGGGTETGVYVNSVPIVNNATAWTSASTNDNNRVGVSATSQVVDFYLSYQNIKQYTGMNTILVGSSVNCTGATTIRQYLYNFTDSAWDQIGSDVSCTTSDVDRYFAHNSAVDGGFVFNDYISAGEMRVRWASTASVTNGIFVDWQYVMLGSVNTDSSLCEISFGTGTATNCTNTRTLNTLAAASTFDIAGEDEAAAMGTGEANSFYPNDTDQDTTVEEGVSANISVPVTVPANAQVVGINWSSRTTSRSTGTTRVTNSLRDYSGLTSTTGGWTDVGAAVNATTQTYQDNVITAAVLSYGQQINPEDYVDTVNGRMNMRLRTSTSGATTDNSTTAWDFAMMSIQWIEDSSNPTVTYQFTPTGQTLVTGTDTTANNTIAAGANGANTGSWKGTLADDNRHWELTGTASGIDVELFMNGVKLNGANTIIVQSEIDVDATAPTLLVQICDWVSTTSVDHAADSNCTGGGWRTLNSRDAVITPTTATAYTWNVYDGKWSNGSNTPVSTPLTNFVTTDSNKRVLVRYYSTTNATTAGNFAIDYLRIYPVINPVYEPGDATALTNSFTGDYTNANTVTQGGADNTDLQCLGTTGGPDCYLSFFNVKTYPSMNTILARSEFACTATTEAPEIKMALRNFTTGAWDDITTEIPNCSTTDTVRIGAKNNITVSDYVSNGEVRLRYYRSSGAGTGAIQIDYSYIMLGTTNSDSAGAYCFISFGTNSANDCTATRTIDMNGSTNNGTTWQILAEDESTNRGAGEANDFYSFDVDMNATASQEGSASHTKFSLSGEPAYGAITGIFFSSQHMAGTAGTVALNIADYSGYNTAAVAAGGFIALGATATTALVYTDNITVGTAISGGAAGYMTNPDDLVNTSGDEGWFRLRTSTDGSSASNAVRQWDFAMMSLQWVETEDRTISFDISDTTIGFGPLTTSNARYATGDAAGSDTEATAHTLTASSSAAGGYTITVEGPTLTSAGGTIDAIGSTNTASSAGTEQFGIKATVAGISYYDAVDDTYSGSGYGYDGTSGASTFATQSQGDGFTSTYSVGYIANMSTGTETGAYSTDLNYIMTGNF